MPLDTVNPFFIEALSTPARYTNAAGVESEINVIFDDENTISMLGGVAVQNMLPIAQCRSIDVDDADIISTLDLHALMIDGDGSILVDDDGYALLMDGAVHYKVKEAHPSETEITELVLTRN